MAELSRMRRTHPEQGARGPRPGRQRGPRPSSRRFYSQGPSRWLPHHCRARRPHRTAPLRPALPRRRAASLPLASQKSAEKEKENGRTKSARELPRPAHMADGEYHTNRPTSDRLAGQFQQNFPRPRAPPRADATDAVTTQGAKFQLRRRCNDGEFLTQSCTVFFG